RTDCLRIVGCLGRNEMGLAAAALDAQALVLHRRKMRTAGDERDLRPGLGQCRAERAADTAGPHHRYTHRTLPSKTMPLVQLNRSGLCASTGKACSASGRCGFPSTASDTAPSAA